MPKFMNAELEAIRDNLPCAHCRAIFKGSDSQAWKVKYEKRIVYCSTACRHAALRNKYSTPVPNQGPCKGCGKGFFSRKAKHFCSVDCYLSSDHFKAQREEATKRAQTAEARAKLGAALKTGETVQCLECGTDVYQKKSKKRRFCCQTCYRSYLSKRFDRWVANPEGMALPQCYDEFLDRDILPCVVEGCTWKGRHLTMHVNQAHGVCRDEFKRAAGFNLSTGVIAKTLARQLQQRLPQGVAISPHLGALDPTKEVKQQGWVLYKSIEGQEHAKKGRALALNTSGPERYCSGCGAVFLQGTPFGRQMYCSTDCRDSAYAEKKRSNSKVRARGEQGASRANSSGRPEAPNERNSGPARLAIALSRDIIPCWLGLWDHRDVEASPPA